MSDYFYEGAKKVMTVLGIGFGSVFVILFLILIGNVFFNSEYQGLYLTDSAGTFYVKRSISYWQDEVAFSSTEEDIALAKMAELQKLDEQARKSLQQVYNEASSIEREQLVKQIISGLRSADFSSVK